MFALIFGYFAFLAACCAIGIPVIVITWAFNGIHLWLMTSEERERYQKEKLHGDVVRYRTELAKKRGKNTDYEIHMRYNPTSRDD